MEFPEKVKKHAKEASAFKCCVCHTEPTFRVHHIDNNLTIEKGLNEFENAAPLCPYCHNRLGHDPNKRKFIREVRDFWYDRVKEMYGKEKLESTKEMLEYIKDVKTGVRRIESELFNVKKSLNEGDMERVVVGVETLAEATTFTSGTIDPSVKLSASIPICPNCSSEISYGNSICPNCGTLLE